MFEDEYEEDMQCPFCSKKWIRKIKIKALK